MRNPWGKQGEWTGDWSDDSDLWTPALSKLVGHTQADDGIFFIPLENYLTHFT
jgi:calpain-15